MRSRGFRRAYQFFRSQSRTTHSLGLTLRKSGLLGKNRSGNKKSRKTRVIHPFPTQSVSVKLSAMNSKQKNAGLTLLKAGETKYPNSPDEAKIEVFANKHPERDYSILFETSEFTSLCPITQQPDFASIEIEYIPDELCIESKSLKLYLFSFRNHGSFAEEIVNRILDDLCTACLPREMIVTGEFTARGGISITVTASYPPA